MEATLRHYFEGDEAAEGLFTDRYWYVINHRSTTFGYKPGIFRQEIEHQASRLERIAGQFEQVRSWAATTQAITVVPDTNVLVHCGNITDIDWGTVAGNASVRVLVPLVVVDELDELKRTAREKSDRTAIRANIKLLREKLAGCKAGQEATLVGTATVAVLPDPLGHRRLASNDQEICERAALVGQVKPVRLATNDMGMHLRAIGFGLETVEVPEPAT